MTIYATRRRADMDNLIKPIQDALEGVVFVNDRLVKDVTGNWRYIDQPSQTRSVSEVLSDAFGNGLPFVHIRIWMAPEEEDLG